MIFLFVISILRNIFILERNQLLAAIATAIIHIDSYRCAGIWTAKVDFFLKRQRTC